MLGAAPQVGPFSLLAARPHSFLDVGLDFQATRKDEVNTILKLYALTCCTAVWYGQKYHYDLKHRL